MIVENRQAMSGYLIGIGKRRGDGSEEYNKIKPVKNMIVKQGLNNWLRLNGDNNLIINPNNNNFSTYRHAPMYNLNFCRYGAGNTPNDFENTVDLESPLVGHYSTKYVSWPYCGSSLFDTNKYRIRVTHISSAATTDQYVREIGYYLNLSNNSKMLFSRIVLPFTYELLAGEQLITTYELILQFPYSHAIGTMNTGLHDQNGNLLEAQFKETVTCSMSGNYVYSNFPVLNVQGTPSLGVSGNVQIDTLIPAFAPAYARYPNIFYSTTAKNFPGNNLVDSQSNLNFDQDASKPIVSGTSYVIDSFYRDLNITIPTFWPRQTDRDGYLDIYYINLLNLALKFGHTVNGEFTPTPWRKYANKTARFVYRQTISTQDSIAWQQQNYGVN